MDLSVFATATFLLPDLGKEKLCSVLIFGNMFFNIVVRINHDNFASRGAVGRTHTIVSLQTRIRRKDGTENFGGSVYVLDGFLQRDFVLWVFMCLINFSVSLFRLPRRRLPRPTGLFSGYHTEGYDARTDAFKLTGYHVCRVTIPELPRSIQTSGYRRVITPAGSYFSSHRLIRQYFHNNNNTFPPSLAHTARTHSTEHLLVAEV